MARSKRETAEKFARTIIRVNLAFRQFLQMKLKDNNLDLTFEMLQVLGCLWQEDGVNQQELADQTVKDKASMTYLIDNISRRGLVTRQEDPNDRRNKLIYLTKNGQDLQKTIEPWVEEMYRYAGDGLSIDALKSTIEQLERIRDNISAAR
jgi:DNA-binding MarR family transcriptional regulator